ncbi:hypothetical protein [Clostridium sp. CF012]|uniref:hypothetical protein n=1 Tax=Clostridium sp. CF012 TaxID=2843319 RepID=UPI001C0B349E|nr:hypothetical protein [Clostridium sp. CF012]MBU3144869.1 hypothetical protein [Clostridium sp. CF012]
MKNIHILRHNCKTFLITNIVIDGICLWLGKVQYITDFNYNLHEMLYLPINLSLLIVPIELILLIYYSTRYFKNIWKSTVLMDLRYKIKVFLCVIFMVVAIGLMYNQTNIVSTFGSHIITNKIIDGSSRYIILDNIKIKCTENEYNLINVTDTYFIGYSWNIKSNVGKLNTIEK